MSAEHGAGADRVGASSIGLLSLLDGLGLSGSARQLSLSLGINYCLNHVLSKGDRARFRIWSLLRAIHTANTKSID
jgi:hypothetical protein